MKTPGSFVSLCLSRSLLLRVNGRLGNVAIDQDATRPDTRGGGFAGDKTHAHSSSSLARVLVRRYSALRSAPLYFALIYPGSGLACLVSSRSIRPESRLCFVLLALSHR